MKNNSIYINDLPSEDNNLKGEKYNSNFLLNLKNFSRNIKIYIQKNHRHKDSKFNNFLYEFNPKYDFEKINQKLKNRKQEQQKKQDEIYEFNYSSKIASKICKSEELRMRLASELDRYSNKSSICETYDLIYKLAMIYSSKIKKYEINFGIFYETPHDFWDTILIEVMKLNNCNVVILTRTLFDNLLLDRADLNTEKIDCNYCFKEINKLKKFINNISSLDEKIEIKSFWNNFNQKNILRSEKLIKKPFLKNKFMEKYLNPIYEFLIKLIRDLNNKDDWRDTSEVFYKQNSVKDKIKANMKRLRYNYLLQKRRICYQSFITSSDQLSLLKDYKKKFVYYPLPVEPERTTVPEGGYYWYHLLSTVTTIRSILPKNIILLVKEHPNMFRKRHPLLAYRSSFFYQEIASLSNTYLLSHDLSSPLIIKSAKIVIVNSGSSGFEAFINGTSVITLGFPWYKDINGIIHADTNKKLSNALKKLLNNKDPQLYEIKNNLSEFLDKKTFIYGSNPRGLSKILNNFSNKELETHSLRSAYSLMSYFNCF